MRSASIRLVAAIMLLSALAATAPARAADESAMPGNVNDQELKAFAKVYVEYQTIRRSYEPKLVGLNDANEKQKVQSEANDKVRQALEKQGLTAQGYNRIFAAVNGNPQLRRKALALIDQEREKS